MIFFGIKTPPKSQKFSACGGPLAICVVSIDGGILTLLSFLDLKLQDQVMDMHSALNAIALLKLCLTAAYSSQITDPDGDLCTLCMMFFRTIMFQHSLNLTVDMPGITVDVSIRRGSDSSIIA